MESHLLNQRRGAMKVEGMSINLKQYITNGFVRTGVIQLGYALCLLVLTGGLGYGTWQLHQSNQLSLSYGMSMILEYLMLAVVGVLLISFLTLLVNGIRSFQHFGQFMKATDVKLEGHSLDYKHSIQIGVALDYLEDEMMVYENRQVVLTNRHLIILEGDPCIYPIKAIRKVSLGIEDLGLNQKPNLAQLKTVVLSLRANEKRKIVCRYLQEAQEILQRLEKQGVKIECMVRYPK